MAGHPCDKTSDYVLGQVSNIAKFATIILSMFLLFILFLFLALVFSYHDGDRDGIYETDRKLCTKNYVKDGDFK